MSRGLLPAGGGARRVVGRVVRSAAAFAALLLLASLGGCRILSDEFAWLDRAGPVTDDPRVAGDQDRP